MANRSFRFLILLSAISTASCGDAVAPPPEGAVSIAVTTSRTATSGFCSPPFTMNLVGGTNVPNSGTTGDLLVNGKDGATVTCRVSGKDEFEVTGRINYKSSWFSINGTINAADGTGTASVSLWYQNGPGETISDPACTVRLGTGGYKVESGAIWASVSCSALRSPPSNPNVWCAGTATFVLKSCDE